MNAYIVAGEKSGDAHGARVMKEMMKIDPGWKFSGLGGSAMRLVAEGIEDWADEAGVMGFVEVAKRFGFFKAKLEQATRDIVAARPAFLLLIDYPGFNLRLAKRVRKLCPETKIVYYISPQVWAWHKGRIPKMAKMLDLMLCIFPFEKQCYEGSGLACEYVGHPLAEEIRQRADIPRREENLVALIPGSREREIERMFPTMLDAAAELARRHPEWKFEVPAASEKLARRMEALRQSKGFPEGRMVIGRGNFSSLLDRATCGVVTSGTASLEAALHGLPYVLVYAVNPVTYLMAKYLVKISHVGMVNILAGKEVVRELLQGDFTAGAVVDWVEGQMSSPGAREELRHGMAAATGLLDGGDAASKVARNILNIIGK